MHGTGEDGRQSQGGVSLEDDRQYDDCQETPEGEGHPSIACLVRIHADSFLIFCVGIEMRQAQHLRATRGKVRCRSQRGELLAVAVRVILVLEPLRQRDARAESHEDAPSTLRVGADGCGKDWPVCQVHRHGVLWLFIRHTGSPFNVTSVDTRARSRAGPARKVSLIRRHHERVKGQIRKRVGKA
jgi:hypothetical protein